MIITSIDKIIYPEPVEHVYQSMYQANTYKGAQATKAGIYKIMLKAGIIDQLGHTESSISYKEARATVIHELKRICYMNNFYYYADPDMINIERLVYYGIRYLGVHKYVFNPLTIEVDFGYYELVLAAVHKLTPRQLMQIFPINKEYDGHKFESKDYFTTMAEPVANNGLDEPIKDPFSFLFDYFNSDTRLFLVRLTSIISEIDQLKGNGDPLMNFFASKGIKVRHLEDFE